MNQTNQRITKYYLIICLFSCLFSLAANIFRIFLTLNYEERPVYGWHPAVFIGLRIFSVVCLIVAVLTYNQTKNINKQKLPAATTAGILITDIITWTLTSGQMIVMILRLLAELKK